MIQVIQVNFVLSKLATLGDTYKNDLILKALHIKRCSDIQKFFLNIHLNYNKVIEYKYITCVELIQHINDAIIKYLPDTQCNSIIYEYDDVYVLYTEPLQFETSLKRIPTKLDKLLSIKK